jgi:hypothetical protein
MKTSAQRKPVARKPAPKSKATPQSKGPAKIIPMVKPVNLDDVPLTDPRHPLHRPTGAKPTPVAAGPAKAPTVVPALPAPKTAALAAVVAANKPTATTIAAGFKVGDRVHVLLDDGKPSKETFAIRPFEDDEPRPVSMKLIDAAQAALDYLKKAGPHDLTAKLETALSSANSEWFAVNEGYCVHITDLVRAS